MESSEQTGAYVYPPIYTNKLIFGRFFFHLVLSEYATQSHNLQIVMFMMSHVSSLL